MKRILVVDNDRLILDFMNDLLSKEGHQVVLAQSGLEALDILKSYRPHIIFVDLVMPKIDGRTLCRIVRRMNQLKDIFLVILSAAVVEKEPDLHELEVNACIAKRSFDEMAKHVLEIVNWPDLSASQVISEGVIGAKGVFSRRITKELLTSEDHFEIVLESMSDGILELTSEGRVIYANSSAVSLLRRGEEKLLGAYYVELFSGDDGRRMVDLLTEMKVGHKVIKDKIPVILNDRYVTVNMIPVDSEGSSAIIILNDVTEQKESEAILRNLHEQLEELVAERTKELSRTTLQLKKEIGEHKETEKALRASEEKYRSLVDNAHDAIFIVQEGGIRFLNPRTEEMLGYSIDELSKIYFADLIHPEDRDMVLDRHKRRLAGEEIPSTYSFRMIRRDGKELWAQLNTVLIEWEGRAATLNFIRDITQQKALQIQFFQAQKMEAIGVVAGGVAHDFNNLLTTIVGNSELALMDVIKDDLLKEELEEIKEAGEKAAALTRQLLAFSRKQIIKPKIFDLNEGLGDLEKMLRRLIGEDIDLTVHREPELWMTYVDPAQIDQVIMNVVVNAREAMPKGGNLTIETANVDLDADFFRSRAMEEKPGPYVMLSLSDTGFGMEEETRSRIFEPFFTTKGKTKGTGLGLSTVYGIVTQSGGCIDVLSTPGQGSTFKIYLPKAKREEDSREKRFGDKDGINGAETILLVEDNDTLRNYGIRVLKRYGYNVVDAQNGEDALIVAEEHAGPIHLVVTDVVMPKMDGSELAVRLQTFMPEIKVLLMSGYSDDSVSHHGVLDSGLAFIEKPFTPVGFAQKVREVLDR